MMSPFFQVKGSPCSDTTGVFRTRGMPPSTTYGPCSRTVILNVVSAMGRSLSSMCNHRNAPEHIAVIRRAGIAVLMPRAGCTSQCPFSVAWATSLDPARVYRQLLRGPESGHAYGSRRYIPDVRHSQLPNPLNTVVLIRGRPALATGQRPRRCRCGHEERGTV